MNREKIEIGLFNSVHSAVVLLSGLEVGHVGFHGPHAADRFAAAFGELMGLSEEFTLEVDIKEVYPETEFEYSGKRYVMLDQNEVQHLSAGDGGVCVYDVSGRCISVFVTNVGVKVAEHTAAEEEPAEAADKPETDTTDAGMTELLTEDETTFERVKEDLRITAQERKDELGELKTLMEDGLIKRNLEYMKMVCDPATGKLLAVQFMRPTDDKTAWIAPGEDFDMAFERLHRAPTDEEITKVREEAFLLGCSFSGLNFDNGYCFIDTKKRKANFTVEPGRPVIDALLEHWHKFVRREDSDMKEAVNEY